MKPLETSLLQKMRKTLLKNTCGNTLELGVGTGVNLPYYQKENISTLTVTDIKMSDYIINYANKKQLPLSFKVCDAANLPFNNCSFDSIVFTLLLCSVKQPIKTLTEINRVLKPNGRLYFIEHVLPENIILKSVAQTINKPWNRFTGCNLNRDTKYNIEQSGFNIINITKHQKACVLFLAGIAKKVEQQ